METILIKHISLETARKNVCYGTNTPYRGQEGEASEWAVAATLQRWPEYTEVPEDEFAHELNLMVLQQTLDGLIEKGLVTVSWDEEKGDFVYTAI